MLWNTFLTWNRRIYLWLLYISTWQTSTGLSCPIVQVILTMDFCSWVVLNSALFWQCLLSSCPFKSIRYFSFFRTERLLQSRCWPFKCFLRLLTPNLSQSWASKPFFGAGLFYYINLLSCLEALTAYWERSMDWLLAFKLLIISSCPSARACDFHNMNLHFCFCHGPAWYPFETLCPFATLS